MLRVPEIASKLGTKNRLFVTSVFLCLFDLFLLKLHIYCTIAQLKLLAFAGGAYASREFSGIDRPLVRRFAPIAEGALIK